MNLFNNHNEDKRPSLSFSSFDQPGKKTSSNHEENNIVGDLGFETFSNNSQSQFINSDVDIPVKHPFKEKVIRAFDRKKILENFDWKTIYFDVKKRAPYLLIVIFLTTLLAAIFTYKVWDKNQFHIAGSKLLYKEIKFESKQILPTNTTLAMIEHRDLMDKALQKLPEYETMEDLKSAVSVNFDKQTKLVRIDVTSESEEQSVKAANTLGNLALESSQQFYYRHFQEKYSNLSRQVLLAEQNMLVQDKLIAAAMKKTGALNVREQYRILMEAISLQERNLLEAQIDYKKRKVQLEILKNEYAKMPDEVVRNSYEDNPLKAQLTNTKMALLNAQSIYGEGNPNILAIQEKIEGLQKQLATQDIKSTLQKVYMPNVKKQEVYMEIARAEGSVSSADNRIKSIMDNINNQRKELYAVPDKEMKLDDTLRKREALAELLDALRKKRQDVEIMMRSEIKDIDLYEASEKGTIVQPKKLLVIPPLVFILIFGLAILYLLFSCVLSQSIRTKKHLDIGFTIPCVMQLANSNDVEHHLFKEIKDLVDGTSQQDFKNIICIQSDDNSNASKELAEYWTNQDKNILLCKYVQASEEDEDQTADSIVLDKENQLFQQVILNPKHANSEIELLNKIKELSFEYDFLIIEILAGACDKTELNLINISDWYFFVVNACKTSRAKLIKRLKDLEYKGICPEGFILDKVNDSLIQV